MTSLSAKEGPLSLGLASSALLSKSSCHRHDTCLPVWLRKTIYGIELTWNPVHPELSRPLGYKRRLLQFQVSSGGP